MTHVPRKRFGQNFLHDRRIIEGIVRHLRPTAGEHIVEIGPGQGAITQHLALSPAQLSVVEIDRDLIARLPQMPWWHHGITLHAQDALTLDFGALLPQPLRIVGNLPYNISTPLLFHLLDSAATVTDLHLMLQREVVQRMCAAPGEAQWGRLSIAVQLRARTEVLLDVPPGCFYPPPKVQSQVIRVTPHQPQPVLPRALDDLLRCAFSNRRKTLRKALAAQVPIALWDQLGIDAGLRAEVLTLTQWRALAEAVSASAYTPSD
ncbi:MAG: 16S rRNA (adenine(1518)-N(6)/adenine(1519)-N(6))-dimethyltransferase RsmA [Oceanococcaceae bacterium]